MDKDYYIVYNANYQGLLLMTTPVRQLTVDPKSNRVQVIETLAEKGTRILTPKQHAYLVEIRRSDAQKKENEGVAKPKNPEIKIS